MASFDSDLLAACARLAGEVQRFYPLIQATAVLAGFAVVGASLVGLHRRSQDRRPVGPALAGLVVGCLLASFTAVVDALTMSLFASSAPHDLSTVQTGSAAGLEEMVGLALTIVMVVGAYQVVRGLVMLKEAAEGARVFWPAVTHIVGGILCLNIRTFLLALGTTFGGSLAEVLNTLLGG